MEELVGKYLAGEASQEEKEKVEAWRSESDKNAEAFFEMKSIWLEGETPEEANSAMLNQILYDETSEPPKIIPLWNQKLFRVAASAIIIMGLVFVILNMAREEQPYGEVLAVNTDFTLPDGSEVTVQRGGMLTIGDFKDHREVTLEGKAFFDVERNEKKPFTVTTKAAIVKVLGTSFVVKSYDEQPTEVLVNSGKVTLKQNPEVFQGNTLSIELDKGEMGELEVGKVGVRKRKIIDENFLSWKTGIIVFRKKNLSEVAEIVEDVYGVEVTFANQSIKNCNLTASFKGKTIEEVSDIIAQTFNFTYNRNGDVITFDGTPCE